MGDLLSPDRLLTTFGAVGIFAILFAETGLLIGFLLPGDTLLIAAGLLAATPVGTPAHLDLGAVLVGAVAGALIGAQVGYHIGRRFGPGLLLRPEGSRIGAGMRRSQDLLERFGPGKAIVLARFVPVARTLMNPLAGATGVPARSFLVWQAAGGLLWTVGIVLLGYFLGATVPDIELYLIPALVLITVTSVLPLVVGSVRQRRTTRARQGAATGPSSSAERPGTL